MLGLVSLWIFVYWWWPASAEPRGISFSAGTRIEQPAASPSPAIAESSASAAKPATDPRLQPPQPRPAAPETLTAPPHVDDRVPAPAVIAPEFIEHTLSPGETYATLSLRYYGTSAYANSISKANPLMSPTSLRPGRAVRVPKDPKNIQGVPAKPPKVTEPKGPSTTYTVQEGDTLSTIAASVYGESRYSKLIFEANRSVLKNEHSLRIGQKLTIPAKPRQ